MQEAVKAFNAANIVDPEVQKTKTEFEKRIEMEVAFTVFCYYKSAKAKDTARGAIAGTPQATDLERDATDLLNQVDATEPAKHAWQIFDEENNKDHILAASVTTMMSEVIELSPRIANTDDVIGDDGKTKKGKSLCDTQREKSCNRNLDNTKRK
jgi:hypothetical protein